MTEIQLPDALLDLFAAFNVTDPEQALILLLSGVLVMLLLLIVVISTLGRPVNARQASAPSKSEPILSNNVRSDMADHLWRIEKDMSQLRERYHNGQIPQDVYIEQTGNLYYQARTISSSSRDVQAGVE